MKRPDVRITVDTEEDLTLIKKILDQFNSLTFSTNDVIELLEKKADFLEINKEIKQKGEKF